MSIVHEVFGHSSSDAPQAGGHTVLLGLPIHDGPIKGNTIRDQHGVTGLDDGCVSHTF